MEIGKFIREKRREQGLSIERLARNANVTYNTVLNIELDKHSPAVNVLQRILDVLGLEMVFIKNMRERDMLY